MLTRATPIPTPRHQPRAPWFRPLVLCGLLTSWDPLEAQQDFAASTATPSEVAPAAGTPNLFPGTATGDTPVPDFSSPGTAPASSFGTPDFSPRAPTGEVPDFTTGGSAPAPSTGGTGTGTPGTAGGATPGATTPRPTTGGFVPGPFSSPASTTPTTPNGLAAPASVFGTTALGNGTGLGAGAGSGTAGLGGANTRTPSPSTESSFTLPGAYGQAPLTFSAGQGRLARPRYVYTSTFQFGYDDNVLQTPTATQGLPAVRQEVLVEPATPDREVTETFRVPTNKLGPKYREVTRTRIIPGREARYETVLVSPAIPAEERIGSAVARAGAGFEMQLTNRQTVFTADAHVNANYYFSRPNDPTDLNGNVGILLAHRFSPRLQVSTADSVAYLSQADVRVISGPTRNVGDYLNINSKTDLSYQWAKRFTTVSSFTLGVLSYQNQIQSINDNYALTLGTEARYQYSRRTTLIAEARAQETFYANQDNRDSITYFLLLGTDFAYSRRLSGTVRVGEAIRAFDSSGDGGSKAAPYLETTTAYRFSPTGSLSWSNRFGFEEPQDATSEVLVFRTNLNLVQAFTARLRGSASIGYIYRVTSYDSSELSTEITGATYTADLGLDYAVTKKFSVNASYSFVSDTSSLEGVDYYRNQIFLGAQYTF